MQLLSPFYLVLLSAIHWMNNTFHDVSLFSCWVSGSLMWQSEEQCNGNDFYVKCENVCFAALRDLWICHISSIVFPAINCKTFHHYKAGEWTRRYMVPLWISELLGLGKLQNEINWWSVVTVHSDLCQFTGHIVCFFSG